MDSLWITPFLLLLLAYYGNGIDDLGPTLTIGQGVLTGRTLNTIGSNRIYHSFQGIPYALPPVGDLRFMPPRPHLKWDGVFEATKDNIKCPQRDALFDEAIEGSEDCLVLNVYTPSNLRDTSAKLPVMFWIHGGGFVTGSSGTRLFGPDFFMDEDIVLVTVNYRLGVLGFMNLQDGIVTGNMGLKDIVMALEWVRDNIRHFGGDESNVTIFGNNAGGAIVSLMMHSPMAKGLFHKAVMQSGSSKLPQLFNSIQQERAFRLANILRKNVKDTIALLKAFKKLEAHEFVKAAPKTYDSTEFRDSQKAVLPFGPSIETNASRPFLSDDPDKTSSQLSEMPTMIGFNSAEAILYLGKIFAHPEILDKLNYNFQFALPLRGLQFEYNSGTYHEVAASIRKFYFPDDGVIDQKSAANYVDYISDGIFYPVAKTAEELSRLYKTSSVYYYTFSYEGRLNHYRKATLNDKDNAAGGASNGDEICYLFRCAALNDEYIRAFGAVEGAVEIGVIRRMVRMWANFAREGNPTPLDDAVLEGFQWKPAAKESLNCLNVNGTLEMDANPRRKNLKFWDEIYDKYAKIEIKPAKTEL